jgi:hypothetical protein
VSDAGLGVAGGAASKLEDEKFLPVIRIFELDTEDRAAGVKLYGE